MNKNTLLVTNVYSNISNNPEKNANELPHRIKKEFVIGGLKIIVFNNVYLQKYEITMGTSMTLFAILVIGYLEISINHKVLERYGRLITLFIVNDWKRYMNDFYF